MATRANKATLVWLAPPKDDPLEAELAAFENRHNKVGSSQEPQSVGQLPGQFVLCWVCEGQDSLPCLRPFLYYPRLN